VTVKAAMTMDGKIATATGESKWVTGEVARAYGMNLRMGADAILVGINTVLADNPNLTVRSLKSGTSHKLRRIILDSQARTPLKAKVVSDDDASLTTIVVSRSAPAKRISELTKRANVIVASGSSRPGIDLRWLLRRLGSENVTSLLVEGGGEVNGSFLLQGLTQRIAFFYAPKIVGGRDSIRAVAGKGIMRLDKAVRLTSVEYRTLGSDLLLIARV